MSKLSQEYCSYAVFALGVEDAKLDFHVDIVERTEFDTRFLSKSQVVLASVINCPHLVNRVQANHKEYGEDVVFQ